MGRRSDLQALLVALLGSKNVYFQPPPTFQMNYPCIVYNRDQADSHWANNNLYNHKTRYQVTIIDRDPDSDIPGKIAALPLCSFNRFFTADSLNHDIYNLFF